MGPNADVVSALERVLRLISTILLALLIVPLFTLLALIAIVAIMLTLPEDTPGRSLIPEFIMSKKVEPYFIALAAALTIAGVLCGTSIRSVYGRVKRLLNNWLARKLGLPKSLVPTATPSDLNRKGKS